MADKPGSGPGKGRPLSAAPGKSCVIVIVIEMMIVSQAAWRVTAARSGSTRASTAADPGAEQGSGRAASTGEG